MKATRPIATVRRVILTWLLAVTCSVLPQLAHSQEGYADLSSQPVGRIHYASLTPRSYYALMDRTSEVPRTTVWGTLHLPDKRKGRVPAIVFSHGSSGIIANQTARWLPMFLKMGMAVFIVDSFGPRGITSTAYNQAQLSLGADVADALMALKLLGTDPRIDPSRIAHIGFSRGGSVAFTTAIDRMRNAVLGGAGDKFAAHIAVYPSCAYTNWRERAKPYTGAPMMFALGAKDDMTVASLCVKYSDRLRTVVPTVVTKVYDGAYHGFDGVAAYHRYDRRSWSDAKCPGVEVDVDTYKVKDLSTGHIYDGVASYPGGFAGCMARGATTSNNWDAASKAEEDVKAFLSDAWARR